MQEHPKLPYNLCSAAFEVSSGRGVMPLKERRELAELLRKAAGRISELEEQVEKLTAAREPK